MATLTKNMTKEEIFQLKNRLSQISIKTQKKDINYIKNKNKKIKKKKKFNKINFFIK